MERREMTWHERNGHLHDAVMELRGQLLHPEFAEQYLHPDARLYPPDVYDEVRKNLHNRRIALYEFLMDHLEYSIAGDMIPREALEPEEVHPEIIQAYFDGLLRHEMLPLGDDGER